LKNTRPRRQRGGALRLASTIRLDGETMLVKAAEDFSKAFLALER
jgi:hypothetical protein